MRSMLELVPPPPASPQQRLAALADLELALLAQGVGEHLPAELVERVLAVRAERAALARELGVQPAPGL